MTIIDFNAAKDAVDFHMESIHEAYKEYSALNWKCLPIETKSKVIKRKDWQNTTFSIEEFKGACNIGVQLGSVSGNLIDIDLDNPIARKIAKAFLPKTSCKFGRIYPGENNGEIIASHYLYIVEGDLKHSAQWALTKTENNGQASKCIEYRGENTQTVFPPSVHEHDVRWVEFDGAPPIISEKDLKAAVGIVMTIIWIVANIQNGQRHTSLLHCIGGFAKAGIPIAKTKVIMRCIAALIEDEEDREASIDSTYHKLETGQSVTGFAALASLEWETDRVKKWLPSNFSESRKVANSDKPKVNMSRTPLAEAVQNVINVLDEIPDEHKRLFSYGPRVVHITERTSRHYRDIKILAPTLEGLSQHLEKHMQFVKQDGKEHVDIILEADPKLVRRIMDPTINWALPKLDGVITHPLVTMDGRIISKRGYDKDTGIFIGNEFELQAEEINSLSVEEALETILDLYADFPFHNRKIGESLSVTALLTSVARKSMRLCPMFVATSPYPADGKTQWCSIPQILLSGEAENYAFSHKDEEQEKQLVTYFQQDPPALMFDNQNGRFQSKALTELLTSGKFNARLLGTNDYVAFSPRSMILINGINVAPSSELATRSVIVNFDRRKNMDFKYPNLQDHIKENRAKILKSCLKLLVHGASVRNDTKIAGNSRFQEWDQLIRKAVVAAGLVDPMRDDIRLVVMDEASEGREILLEWLFEQFPPGVKFISKDIFERIGMNLNLIAIINSTARRDKFSVLTVGAAMSNFRGTEYNRHRMSWHTGAGNKTYGQWKPIIDRSKL